MTSGNDYGAPWAQLQFAWVSLSKQVVGKKTALNYRQDGFAAHNYFSTLDRMRIELKMAYAYLYGHDAVGELVCDSLGIDAEVVFPLPGNRE